MGKIILNTEELPENYKRIVSNKKKNIEDLHNLYCQIVDYNTWVLPSTGLLPVLNEDLHAKNFSMHLLNKIYVGNLPYHTTKSDIHKMFEIFGPISSISLSIEGKSKLYSKKFGFVEFENPNAAVLAIKEMNTYEVDGKALKVGRPANFPSFIPDDIKNPDKRIIYVSNIHEFIDQNQLLSIFECVGKVEQLNLMLNKNRSCHMGIAFIKYQNIDSADLSVSLYNNLSVGGKILKVCKTVIKQKMPSKEIFQDTITKLPNEVIKIIADLNSKLNDKTENECLVLKNMIMVDDLDEDFINEIKLELKKYGEILELKIVVFQPTLLQYTILKEGDKKDVEVYCLFRNSESVNHCYRIMDGRYFGGRRIYAESIPKSEFNSI
ncbi:poly(U)-binding-splicing factor [Hamiltosporidium tvaerminnensis]|uniref:Poly(U)-binding-splicing factor n=1 Tax=Hamiltosporidium tvaerminnensis TaxID=1176355 RepID=A0A4Q9LZC4_9MICR|nr:poly(U)-binding-splicing factor [Hamiltosporidium tvaerminnensis]